MLHKFNSTAKMINELQPTALIIIEVVTEVLSVYGFIQ